MRVLRAIIVDDEPVARKVLREEIASVDQIEVVGEADNGQTALLQISSLEPDVVFLDIQMPVMGGFELLHHLEKGRMPVVIMVTAYDQHAIRAFEEGAIDYLLKPVSQQRLAQAVERAARIVGNPQRVAESVVQLQDAAATAVPSYSKIRKIIGKLGEEYFLLNPTEVLAFQADGDMTWIVTAKQKYLSTQNLRTIEERFPNGPFRRIHRNALVNIHQIRKMSVMTSQRWLVTLSNGHEFIVSKRLAKNVRDVLSW